MQCGLQDSADLTVFNLLDIMMFFLTVPHWAVYTLVLLLHVCTLILIDIDIDIQHPMAYVSYIMDLYYT